MEALRVSELWKIYDTGTNLVQAIRGVNLTLKNGEMVAIMGPSGCGKTTFLNVISGLDDISSGQVSVAGVQLTQASDAERTQLRAESFGFIFQDFALLETMTALENVEMPLQILGRPADEVREKAMQALAKVGLEDRASHRPAELSGGQQQRVALARAIVHEPKILLGDEPTGNLDTATGEEVISLLKELNEEGMTVILVTHDPGIAKSCSRIINLKDGRIVSDDGVEEE